jgi:2-polyprenyl-3-methyl-5-hydroxy-6-metoxy-1,4-benzoquinol methylase
MINTYACEEIAVQHRQSGEDCVKDDFAIEARFYDRVWGKYDYDSDVKLMNEVFREHRYTKIIDIGCGTGNHAIRLSALGYTVTAIDVSPAMLKIAKNKDTEAKVRFVQGDMKEMEEIVTEAGAFDAAICLGHVFSHLTDDRDVDVFLKKIHDALVKNGLFIFNASNARKIDAKYLNNLCLDHMVNEERLQLLVLAYNARDTVNPDIIVWRPIYLVKEDGDFDMQIREHRLRWFRFSKLKKSLLENHFEISAAYSGPEKEEFVEDVHSDMWFLALAK